MSSITSDTQAAIRIERDLRHGEGAIGYGSTRPGNRALLMDVYLPPGDAPPGGRPALVLSHGGAFHRGAKDCDEFEQGGSHNTPVHVYCERFALRGYVCFSIGYRLTQEQPAPLARPVKRVRERVERGRIDFVRGLLGLPPATVDESAVTRQATGSVSRSTVVMSSGTPGASRAPDPPLRPSRSGPSEAKSGAACQPGTVICAFRLL
jgi:hypothetical protein